MKKIFLLSALIGVGLIAGCNSKDKESTQDKDVSVPASTVISNESIEQTVIYETADKKQYILTTTDNFTTANLVDSDGNSYELKEVPAGSGMRLEGPNGVAIHTKGDEGIIELSKDQIIDIKEVK
ncbi:MliC family protein [Acinetobacter sp. ANC 4648]|uniref:MliC family protein n=1 Tax=Acinetobacter sp. ANC 4648 TaxID=1977875 RepID=UPI000A3503FC|nr:MliC family protein [Acinetobacter sp. ANC 4648]OTG81627.1 NADPH-dependent 7-cyano-7-deazaguanine reductase [Acinetobacter sp. ANC 4648]